MPLDAQETPESSLQHIVVIWMALFIGLVGAFALTVIGLNSTVFSPSGFVKGYLHALERGDIDEALSTPGVITLGGGGHELLTADALGPISDIRVTSDIDQGSGVHLISYSATLGGIPASGSFDVLEAENRFGLFSAWSFLVSPVSELQVTPMHDASFTVNGIDVTSPNGANVSTSYPVLTPGVFTLTHRSTYLTATPLIATVTKPGSDVPAVLNIRASRSFVADIQEQMNEFLDECATQEVLFPTGCPFGQELYNRVESAPKWSIASYPEVTVEPGNDPGTWIVPEAQAAAHLTVEVRSLFDGSLSTFDEDVPFGVSWTMTINGDRINIQQ